MAAHDTFAYWAVSCSWVADAVFSSKWVVAQVASKAMASAEGVRLHLRGSR